MIAHVAITETGATPKLLKRGMPKIMKTANIEAGKLWHTKLLPKHFTVKGGQEYGYAQRSKRYRARKRSKKRTIAPLVWSGESKKFALGVQDVRATSKKGVVRLHGTKFGRTITNSKVDMKREVTATSPRDLEMMADVMNKTIEREVRKVKTTKKRKIV